MLIDLPFAVYKANLDQNINDVLDLEIIARPFNLPFSRKSSSFLLVGHLLDELNEQYSCEEFIDIMDVATVAYELGFDDAAIILDQGPQVIYQMIKNVD